MLGGSKSSEKASTETGIIWNFWKKELKMEAMQIGGDLVRIHIGKE